MIKKLPNFNSNIEKLLPFSKIRLIVLDLDGTIIDSSKPSFPEIISELARSLKHHKHNVMMSIATGRTFFGAEPLLKRLPLSRTTPIILYNGSIVLNADYELLLQKVISNTSFRKVVKISSKFNVKLIAYICQADTSNNNKLKELAIGWSSLDKPKLEHNLMPVEWFKWNNFENDLTPSAIVIHTGGSGKLLSAVCKELKKINGISFTLGSSYIEVSPLACNKGSAIEFVAQYLHFSKDQILTMGDNDNDASMLSWAGIGVAVDSASSLAKNNSDFIARGVIEGAIEVLRLVRSAKHLMNRDRKTKVSPVQLNNDTINMSVSNNSTLFNNSSMFISKEKVIDYCYQKYNHKVDKDRLEIILNNGLLPLYSHRIQKIVLKNDLIELISSLASEYNEGTYNSYLAGPLDQKNIRVNPYTTIDLVREDSVMIPTFFSATRNLISEQLICSEQYNQPKRMSYFSGSILTTLSNEDYQFAKLQLDREVMSDVSEISQFARSAHYMGSKRLLCGFIIEAISSVLPKTGIVIDLMCGSGVVSGAFNKIWKTYSSDSQRFCRVLSVIHSGNFNIASAQNLISKILPVAKQHFFKLQQCLGNAIKDEDDLFCRNTDMSLLKKYKKFVKDFPTLPNNIISSNWNPKLEIKNRKKNPFLEPYCLFTTYFSNVYFGVRQCVEIDSLRYAIDQLNDETEKECALGALITSLSALGTTYGGHFAQPKIKDIEDLTLKKLSNVIDTRSSSITHEFTVRLLNLSEQNQHSSEKIEVVEGPWENALSTVYDIIKEDCSVLVYLDAPYTREEYSRYYHVLETLVLYNYPSCLNNGLTPKPGERFRSEFFKRDAKQIEKTFISIITNILQKNWYCAWSYSDSGTANICEVINTVCQKSNCEVKSYSVPSVHKSQGGAKPKNVTEYLIIFSPQK